MAVTSPRSVISPVIATLARTGMPVSADTKAVAIAAPALGPSLGVAPSGTWMWMSRFSNISSLMPRRAARLRITVRAASTDSFITSPSDPVRMIWPLPGITADSIVSRSPPTSVHARPTTWPTWFFFSARPKSYLRTPRKSFRFSSVTTALPSCVLSCTPLTTLRQTLEISRSSERTPASRV